MKERLTLAETASLIPCHYRSLLRHIAEAPETAPRPLPRDTDTEHWRFSREEVERWLELREILRAELGKPHKRWLDEDLDEEPLANETLGAEQDERRYEQAAGIVASEIRRDFEAQGVVEPALTAKVQAMVAGALRLRKEILGLVEEKAKAIPATRGDPAAPMGRRQSAFGVRTTA